MILWNDEVLIIAGEVLKMLHIVEIYPNGVMVNKGVTLSVDLGEIHALSGENGAGESTLTEVLFGEEQPTSGEIFMNRKQVHMSSPQMVTKMRIGMVHQHFMLVSSLTVAENIIPGMEPRKGAMVDLVYARKQVEGMGRKYNLYMEPNKWVEDLTVGQKQKVEIPKVPFRGAKILTPDGPMAVFVSQETQELFEEFLNLEDHGYTIIFISHKLQKIKQVYNRTTVVRRGITMGVHDAETVSGQDIFRPMVGRDMVLGMKKDIAESGEALVKVKDLMVVDENGKHAVDHVSFSLRKEKILGIVGMEGDGQTELVRAMTGMGTYNHGATEMSGQDTRGYSVERIRNPKLVHIPADGMTMGMAPRPSTTENMIADKLSWKRFFKKGVRGKRAVKEYGEEMVKQYLIFCKSQDVAINSLSGGNIQKAVLAKELSGSPQIIITDQPTRDVDMGATEFIRQRLVEMRDEGNEATLVTSDLNEALRLSDSLIVIYEEKIVACVSDTSKVAEAQLGTYMLGIRIQSEEKIKETQHEQ